MRDSNATAPEDRNNRGAPRRTTSSHGALPNLVIIGAQKAGTSSLHRYLDLHPEISMSRPKELNFFMLYPEPTDEELEWYKRHFTPSVPVRGESSPNYSCYPQVSGVAARIHRLIPGAKLIYLVRDPVQRAVSSYLHARAMGTEKRTVAEALDDPDAHYVSRSCYYAQLEQYLAHFPLDQILVLGQEALLHRRSETMRRIFRFLEVDDSFWSSGFEQMWEVSSGKGRAYRMAYRASRLIGGPALWSRLPVGVRWLGERLIYRPKEAEASRPELDEALRARLEERFREDARKLRRLTGESFVEWSV